MVPPKDPRDAAEPIQEPPPEQPVPEEKVEKPRLEPTRYGDWELNGKCVDF